ncbi:MAG TPA: CPBP family intramembrane glutamic endopeptidase [Polyangiaceae bacterium]|nr:CPBP family intramembrane glutamic endopeptidase [Polyangiaceae bacterium]
MDCPDCGAFNSRLADECSECGWDFAQPAESREHEADIPGQEEESSHAPNARSLPRVSWARRALLLGAFQAAATMIVVVGSFDGFARTVLYAIPVVGWLATYFWARHDALAGLLAGVALFLFTLWVRLTSILELPWSEAFSVGILAKYLFASLGYSLLLPGPILLLLGVLLLRGVKSAAELRGEAAWQSSRSIIYAFAWMLAVGAAATGLPASTLSWSLAQLAGYAPFIYLAYQRRRQLLRAYAELRLSGRALGLAGLSLLACYVVSGGMVQLLALGGLEPSSWTQSWLDAGWSLPALFVLLGVWAPLSEEVIFRGYLQERFEASMTPRNALVLQATFFAMVHLANASLVTHLVMGLVLGMLRNVTRGLYLSVAVHALWNIGITLTELGVW